MELKKASCSEFLQTGQIDITQIKTINPTVGVASKKFARLIPKFLSAKKVGHDFRVCNYHAPYAMYNFLLTQLGDLDCRGIIMYYLRLRPLWWGIAVYGKCALIRMGDQSIVRLLVCAHWT